MAELGFKPRLPGCRAWSRHRQRLPDHLPVITFPCKPTWCFKPPAPCLHNPKVSTSLDFATQAPHLALSGLRPPKCQHLDLTLSTRAGSASVGANEKCQGVIVGASLSQWLTGVLALEDKYPSPLASGVTLRHVLWFPVLPSRNESQLPIVVICLVKCTFINFLPFLLPSWYFLESPLK